MQHRSRVQSVPHSLLPGVPTRPGEWEPGNTRHLASGAHAALATPSAACSELLWKARAREGRPPSAAWPPERTAGLRRVPGETRAPYTWRPSKPFPGQAPRPHGDLGTLLGRGGHRLASKDTEFQAHPTSLAGVPAPGEVNRGLGAPRANMLGVGGLATGIVRSALEGGGFVFLFRLSTRRPREPSQIPRRHDNAAAHPLGQGACWEGPSQTPAAPAGPLSLHLFFMPTV